MEPIEILAQVLSIIGMVINILSMQCKKTRGVIAMILVGSTFFGVSYLLLGSFAGAIMNVFSVFRSLLLLFDKRTRANSQLVLLLTVLFACSAIGLYLDGPIALLPLLGQFGGTMGMWQRNSAKLRLWQLFGSSPFWLINNIIVFSIGGILCEVFVITSVLVSIARYGWKYLKVSD
ncbi:MAG: YgjV family protein [Clostridia bacterium]|nr:YgjV family protein [Clostridia bacterium]